MKTPKTAQTLAIEDMLRNGVSGYAIAKMTGLSFQRVYQIKKAMLKTIVEK